MINRIIMIISLFLFINTTSSLPVRNNGSAQDLNLILITLDTTRADVIGYYNNKKSDITPNIDLLGNNGISFMHCYANVPLTLPAHCSLFTGRLPYVHQVRNNGSYFLDSSELTMAEIFRSQGYRTAAIISSFTLCSKFGVGQGFETYIEDFDHLKAHQNFHTEIPADQVYKKFQDLIKSLDDQKFFFWIHFYDPHFPYIAHENISPEDSQSQWKRYESEVRYVDTYIGKMISTLETKQLLDKTIVVIVGDHGEAFGEHGEYGHGIFCYEESLKVPLIIYNQRSFKEQRSVEDKISLVDILPSLLELYDFDVPKNIQGRSFLRLLQGKKEKQKRTIYFESMFGKEENNWASPIGIIDNDLKFISLPTPELYDLKKDNQEINNLFSDKRKVADTMKKNLEQFLSDSSINTGPRERKLSKSDKEKLESLGYISNFSNQSKSMIDPKQGIVVYTEVEEINDILKQKNVRLAEARLNDVIAKNPDVQFPRLYQTQYRIEKSKGNVENAIEFLRKALTLFPEHESIKFSLASELFTSGSYPETKALCRELIDTNDQFTSAYLLMGDVDKRLNQIKGALEYYEKAASIEPQNAMIKAGYADLLMRNDDLGIALTTVQELENIGNFSNSSAYLDLVSELGNRFLAKGELSEALPLMKKVTELDPDNPAAWVNLGSIYFGLNQIDAALECFQNALEIDENFALALSNIGLVFLNKFYIDKKSITLDKAMEYFNEAIHHSPSLGAAYQGRALAQVSYGNMKDAVKDFAMAIELEPELLDAYFNLANILAQLENYSEAYKYLALCKKRFYHMLPPNEKAELDRMLNDMINRIK